MIVNNILTEILTVNSYLKMTKNRKPKYKHRPHLKQKYRL